MIDATFIEIATGIGGIAGGLWFGQSKAKTEKKKYYEAGLAAGQAQGVNAGKMAAIEAIQATMQGEE